MATHEIRSVELSSYLDYLPAIYREDPDADSTYFLGRFLLAFERILTGVGDPDDPGFEEIADGIPKPDGTGWLLAGLHRYFDPGYYFDPKKLEMVPKPANECAPVKFLDWLAGWVALSLRGDLDELRQRDFIARAVSLYRLRGTKRGLEQLLGIYTRLGATVNELNTPFQVGVHSTVGVDTLLDGGAPHFFQVLIRIPTADPEQIRRTRTVAMAIIDAEKPAHTVCKLDDVTPKLQVGVQCTVGVDTLIG